MRLRILFTILLPSIALASCSTSALETETTPPEKNNSNLVDYRAPIGDIKLSLGQTRRLGDRRPDDQYRIFIYGKPLTIGGEYEIKPTYRKDFSLGKSDDDRLKIDQKLEVELFYEWSEQASLFVEGKYRHKFDRRIDENKTDSYQMLERGEIWAYYNHVFNTPWSVKAGRQSIQDKREWWWGRDLDAIRARFKQGAIKVDIALAEEMGTISTYDPFDPGKKDVFRILAHARWDWNSKQRLELFSLYQNDHSDSPKENDIIREDKEDDFDGNLFWIGARAMGRLKVRELKSRAHYWADLGYVTGRESEFDYKSIGLNRSEVKNVFKRDVRGWGMDIGVTLETQLAGKPSFTLGYAYGSGDDNLNDGSDHAFRQTGLQDNNGKFRGVDRFRYYGELLRPELSNLHIFTLSAGYPLLRNSSVEFLFHRYRQADAAPFLRNTKLRTRPEGTSTDIGSELDIVLGIEEGKHIEIELVGGIFESGNAFGNKSGRRAYTAIFKADYNF